jgi:hypothetical protein
MCKYMYELYYALEACEEFDIYTPPVVPKKRISKRVSMVQLFYDETNFIHVYIYIYIVIYIYACMHVFT